MKVLVGGCGGLVGGALIDYLAASDNEIVRLSRSPGPAGQPTVVWDPAQGVLPAADLEGDLGAGGPNRRDLLAGHVGHMGWHLGQLARIRKQLGLVSMPDWD